MGERDDTANPFDRMAKGFEQLLGGWTEAAGRRIAADGPSTAAAAVLDAMKTSITWLSRQVGEAMSRVFDTLDPQGKLEWIRLFAASGVEAMLDAARRVIETILGGASAAASATLAALLGLIEAIKKSIHLILDRMVDPKVAAPVRLPLDLLNNLLGNVAEIMAPEAGTKARRFRTDMYAQLHDIRRADAARKGAAAPRREEPDD